MLMHRLSVRCLVGIVSAIALSALAYPCEAQGQNKAAPADINPIITFHFTNVPPLDVLKRIFQTSEQRYEIVPATLADQLNAPPTIELHVTAQTLKESLRELFSLLETPLTFRVKDGLYIIEEDRHPNPSGRVKNLSVQPNETKISKAYAILYNVTDLPFDEAVSRFFRVVNKPYRIDPSVPVFLETVTCDLKENTVPGALEKLLNSVSHSAAYLIYRRENGVYVILPRHPLTAYAGKADSGDGRDAPLKDVHLVNASPADALKTLFTQAKASGIFFFPSDTKKTITLSLHNVSLGHAVAKMARSLPADWNLGSSRRGSIYVIGDGVAANSLPIRLAQERTQTITPGRAQTITLCLEKAKLYDTLKTLFTLAHVNYTLDPSLNQQNVTVTGTASTLDAALHLLLDAAPKPQTFKIENDIYSIVPK